ncbi:hypothetical protein, partial [Streptomyces sp. NPDC051098]|uniref:hypothetical protein n=1 Tax=Streptomyces sp. NPDC051098 TaxID=3155411 RepID=UPI0034315F37
MSQLRPMRAPFLAGALAALLLVPLGQAGAVEPPPPAAVRSQAPPSDRTGDEVERLAHPPRSTPT